MKDFHVKVTDVRTPIGSGYDLDHYIFRKCGQYAGTPEPSSPAEIKCGDEAIGQYVYVHVDGTNQLQFCEVEIFGDREYLLIMNRTS